MKKLLLLIACFPFFSVSAQTCVGILSIRLVDQKTKKPVENLEKNIWYVFTKPQAEFYDEAEAIQPLDSMLKEKAFTSKHNEQGYNFFEGSSDKSMLSFPALCGLYLIQTEFIQSKDTMRLAWYNVPAHQSFQMDTLVFKKGNFFVNFQGSRLLSELEFDDRGWFVVPTGVITPFPKKKED